VETKVRLECILLLLRLHQGAGGNGTITAVKVLIDLRKMIYGSAQTNDAIGYIMKLFYHHRRHRRHHLQVCFSHASSFLVCFFYVGKQYPGKPYFYGFFLHFLDKVSEDRQYGCNVEYICSFRYLNGCYVFEQTALAAHMQCGSVNNFPYSNA
jgi:hypothetical protein